MHPIHVIDDTFETAVLTADKPVVVDFWADWCPPCHTISIWMDNLAKSFTDQLIVAKVDADENKTVVDNYEVRGLPTILFFNQGNLILRQVDEINEEGLLTLVTDFLAQL